MKRKVWVPLTSFIFLFSSYGYGQDKTITAHQIIDKAIDALGGKEYLLSIKSLSTVMTIEQEGVVYNVATTKRFPNKIDIEIKTQDSVISRLVFDGKIGLKFENGEQSLLDVQEFKDDSFRKNIFEELDYLDSTLWKITFVKEDKIDGIGVYQIIARSNLDSMMRIVYYSKTSFQLLLEIKFKNEADENYEITEYSDYKRYGKLSFYSTVKYQEGPFTTEYKIVDVTTN